MIYRNLGRSGLKVSPLCLGTMMFGAWGNRDHDESIRIIHAALDAGINFIDTSNNYAAGESETIVGKALEGRRDEVVLATKVWSPMGPGPHQRGLSRKAILAQVEQSLRRLRTDWIDLYQIHRSDPETPWEETLSTLDDLVRRGTVRYVGCSTSHHTSTGHWDKKVPAWEIAEALAISERNRFERFIALQPPYSILRRTMEAEHFPMCRHFGLGVSVWSPLEGGWLAGKYRGRIEPVDTPRSAGVDPRDPKFERRRVIIEALAKLAEAHDVPLARFSNAWTLRHPAVTSVVLGPRTMDQLLDSVSCAELEIDAAAAASIDELVPPGTCAL